MATSGSGTGTGAIRADGTALDAELVRAARAGDAGSLGELLQRHRGRMHAVALSILGHGSDAEDAVQEAVVVALARIGDVREPAAVGAWLLSIVRNACLMRLRSARETLLAFPEALELPAHDPTPEEVVERQLLSDWVWGALQELSEPLRLVAMLRYFTGVTSYAQIAMLCGVPVGTVRSRLSDARRKLADSLLATTGPGHMDAVAQTARLRLDATSLVAPDDIRTFASTLTEGWSPEVEITGPAGRLGVGREILIRMMESDLDAGVRQRPVNMITDGGIAIIEADLLNPRDDPHHCPPSVVWLQFLRGGRVHRLRLFHPRPPLTPVRHYPS